MEASLDNLDIAESAVKSAAVVAIGAATGGYGFSLAIKHGFGSVAMGIGGSLLAGSVGYCAGTRIADEQSAPEVIEGTLSDVSGWTAIYTGLYEEDPVTGERIELTSEQRGERIGGGAVQLVLVVVGVTQSLNTARTEITLSNPFKPSAWTSTPQGALVGSGPTGTTLALPLPGVNTQVVTGTLGVSTPLVVYMSGRPNDQGFDPEWPPGEVSDHPFGCDEFAQQIQQAVGGEIVTIQPKPPAPLLAGFKGEPIAWGHHTVVVKNGRVYDAFTGHQGMTYGEYKALWEFPGDILFPF